MDTLVDVVKDFFKENSRKHHYSDFEDGEVQLNGIYDMDYLVDAVRKHIAKEQ